MSVELKVPEVGESISEVQIATWRKGVGDWVEKDENLVEIESDKATVELPAPVAGTITEILKKPGEQARVGEVIGYMSEGTGGLKAEAAGASTTADRTQPEPVSGEAGTAKTRPEHAPVSERTPGVSSAQGAAPWAKTESHVMPSAQRMAVQEGIRPETVRPSGLGGRTLKEDVQRAVEERARTAPPTTPFADSGRATRGELVTADYERGKQPGDMIQTGYPREEELVVMSPIRRRIAQRLVEAQQTAALLTTFNEVDLSEVIALRGKYRERYEKHYGVKLGFMSFFVKAAIDALRGVPQLNAEVREPHVVYRNYYDIGIAVGGGKGLVVPVLRNAEFMSFAEIEQKVADFGRRAAENKLKLDELQGGTFTISNGGVYGSMLSTPIINPPQSGILGLHAIEDRPVARDGQVVVRPMMYLALTYDHRIVDGREAVLFLKRVKETIEDPSRMLLEI